MEPEGERELLWGRHAVVEALKGDRPVNKIWMLRGLEEARTVATVRRLAREKGAVVQEVDRAKLDALAAGPHQGLVAAMAAATYADFDQVLVASRAAERPLLLVLDGIEDPHNLGALVRTAGASGAQGVVIPLRRAVGLTGVVAKAAAGALEHVPVTRVANLVRAIGQLKEAGIWVVGADEHAEGVAYDADLTGPVALVIGAEGQGLSRLVRESCDLLVRFPMQGQVPSLNASVAGGLLLFEAVRQRQVSRS